MRITTTSAPGKIILSGEYAVVFGHPGIAIPAPIHLEVQLEETPTKRTLAINWADASEQWIAYLHEIIRQYEKIHGPVYGTVTIKNALPLGKGMGSSTALIIAIGRAIFGDDCMKHARHVEDTRNPGHSGIDFAVIWENMPILYMKGKKPAAATVSLDFLKGALLIDTGTPQQPTPELVAWVKEREKECEPALMHISHCAARLLAGEDPLPVIRDHHKAQVALGVVPPKVQKLIAAIEKSGGAAKVIGAGAKSGGGGMVLALSVDPIIVQQFDARFPIIKL